LNKIIKNHNNSPPVFPFPWADQWGKDRYGIWVAFTIEEVRQCMRWIKPGKFMMGSPKGEKERYDDETQHEVILTEGFWLADTACTQALWQAVMGENPSGFKGPQRPVEQVSWEDCKTFIDKTNRLKPGLDLCLPSEAQWEYACRAGTETPFWFGDNITPEQVNYRGTSPYADGKKGEYREQTVDVKSLPCNGWGLYQMHGNVWEWCEDWYGEYAPDLIVNPTGPDSSGDRVCRGGSWFSNGRLVRSAIRVWYVPSSRVSSAGLRFAQVNKGPGVSRRETSEHVPGRVDGAERNR
jgi:formylglycine-generating enzyme required for sulfatase activity